MEKEILERLGRLEHRLASKQKDAWDKIAAIIPLFIPLAIAFVGWHYTNEHNRNELELQKQSHESSLQVAYINSSVGQSELIKDFMEQLTNPDTAVRNIAIEAVLYAAPTPGKHIVEIIARNEGSGAITARSALDAKRHDLAEGLFASQSATRLQAAAEITNNWTNDNELFDLIVAHAERCLLDRNAAADCSDGVYNTIVVLPTFSRALLHQHRDRLRALVEHLPRSSPLTVGQGAILTSKLE